MSAPIKYTMTEDEYATLLKASQPVPYMIVGGIEPASPQENANQAWRHLANVHGFDWNTVTPIPGGTQRDFLAVPIKDDDTCQNCGQHLDIEGHAQGCGNADPEVAT